GVFAQWYRMGHILGAAAIRLEIDDKVIVFSGDIGRYNVPILVDPSPVPMGDLLLIESTYGDRNHADSSPQDSLAAIVNKTAARGGVVVIPSFAVGRAQLLLYYLRELKENKLIPDIPVIVDSPMATDATNIYRKHESDYDEAALKIVESSRQPFDLPKLGFITERQASQRLNKIKEPMIIISASGMLTGGRILHHLKHRISEPENSIVFVGYQPPGGRGDWIQRGAQSLRLFGHETPINAEVGTISGLSAHADKDELHRWCESANQKPGKVAVVHGEPDSAQTFSESLRQQYQWDTSVPQYLEELTL
ncbi:MAG: MBL fold metallo-hydrolase, partial [Bdellovibrionales bacterium]|nr:MBL fold metallo-hydrolase [Bdellovibrionales bacterium]